MRRSDQRRAAVVAVYQHDLTGRPLIDTLGEGDVHEFTRALAQAAVDRADELDELIATHARGWAIDRIAPLERSIMRVALVEMLHPESVPGREPIPPEGAIDEAIETTKLFCAAEAPAFVNGILDAILGAVRQNPQDR